MKLWLLERHVDTDSYDVVMGLVVRAPSEAVARQMAQGRESQWSRIKDIWIDPKKSSCEALSARGKAEVIITDFAAG
jgi:hypothetical protein